MEALIQAWHQLLQNPDMGELRNLLAEDAVFHSPVVFTPQEGREITALYLGSALKVLVNPSFRYTRQIIGEQDAVLEFEVEIEGIKVNGVDMIRANEQGQIEDFKVMLRPLKAINLIHQKMAALVA